MAGNRNKSREARRKKRRARIDINRIKNFKLGVMMSVILIAFSALGIRLYYIEHKNQSTYQKKILSQQSYDSTTLPFKRGSILDCNGTILAASEKVYNVILDTKVMMDDEKNEEPTLSALAEC
jgi:stage V sporulation protein D (sporulation-specific penicillin-binding protein)